MTKISNSKLVPTDVGMTKTLNNKIIKKLFRNNGGYIALISVLIMSAVVLAIAITLNLSSVDETKTGLLKEQSLKSFSLADACLEESFIRLKRDSNYTGGQLNFKDGYCIINISGNGNSRIINIEANVNNIIRKIRIDIRITGNNIIQNNWQEL